LQQAEQQRIAAQTAREQAGIQARAAAAQAEREFKADQEAAKAKSKLEADIAKRMSAVNLETMRTNSVWNLSKAKAEASKNKPNVTWEDKSNPDMVVKRTGTTAEFEKYKAQKKAEENAPELERLQGQYADLAQETDKSGPQGWFGKDRSKELLELGQKIEKLQAPENLLQSNDIVPPAAAAPSEPLKTRSPAIVSGISSMTGPGWAPPTPRGIIGTPERNMFTAETDIPENLTRAGVNDWAIAINTPATYRSPEGVQPGYNPSTGSFQTQASTPPANLLGAPGEADWSIPKSTPAARPRIPNAHIEHLIQNPDTADQFDSKYGSGTADEILNR
jgi:hypothetical protein